MAGEDGVTPVRVATVSDMTPCVRLWSCYRCPRLFQHGRHLAGHLIEVHGEGR